MKTAAISNACNVSHTSKSTSFIQEVAREFLKSTVSLTSPNLHVNTSQVTVSVYQALEHNKEVALSAGKFCGWAFICGFGVIGELLECKTAVHLQRIDRLYAGHCFLAVMLKLCHICTNNLSIKALPTGNTSFWMVLAAFL